MRTATIESGRRAEPSPPGEPVAGGPLTASTSEPETGSQWALKNWRVRTRLLALIVPPTLIAMLLGGFRVSGSIAEAAEYQRVRQAIELVGSIGALTHELQLERDMSIRYVALNRRSGAYLSPVRRQQGTVDTAVEQVRVKMQAADDAFGGIGRQDVVRARGRLGEMPALRETVLESQLPPLPAITKYSILISDLLRLYDTAAEGVVDEELNASIKALGSLVRAKEEVSKQRALLAVGLARQQLDPSELDAFTAARAGQESELAGFFAEASTAQRQFYSDTVTGQKIDRAAFLAQRALSMAKSGRLIRALDRGSDEQRWFDAASFQTDSMRKVGDALTDTIIAKSTALEQKARSGAVSNIILVIGLLLVVVLITTVMARSLVRPLRRLRTEALEIAGQRLPETVQRLRESESADGPPPVQPLGVASADEVGEVARAFDEVHREAVRLAGDEARLRSNISAMFVNLSRRTQTLVERQIALIDGLEQGEQDENRLGNLFKLDHLATRMRRNSENLLVLAGQEPARRWSRPVEVTDVVRASLSEVEGYERVVINVPSEVALAGQAVNDAIHLLAELVENALSFSSRDTRVIVSGNRIDGGGVMISITDSGIGMAQEEISQANWRLANPPVVDVSVSRRMGLFVVGRLALRNGIRVQLRPHDSGGLTAMVLLPESLVGHHEPPAQSHAGAFAGAMAGHAAAYAAPQEAGVWGAPPDPSAWAGPPDQPSWSGPIDPSPWSAASGGVPGERSDAVSGGWQPPGAAIPPQDTPIRMRPRRELGAEDATGPLPALSGLPMEAEPEEFLPIFASVESAWFRRTPTSEDDPEWGRQENVEAGWQAADAAVRQPASEGSTSSGLPKRVPRANLVPGTAGTSGTSGTAASGGPVASPPPALSADRVRSRLSSLQRGVQQGRAVARGELSEDQGYPGPTNVEDA
ncbi:nitrate- and nitrite sensing domain-containing protein [Microtetraspora malaysiensis]|uniref:sensor histidine kinase n=1 Tax=Microtetraspora malaysiensis TaxID=161358 RepID=UPI003D9500D5